ncbi:hypothetical protein Fmac_008110 [Flemingia macrophylla]|uniref:Amino acid transporter transmembrane domain-containing protein n=1 Tax=Flemingia macrophylla TaxID=520843 RepID=A0ABD1MWG2_9FABA
MNQAEAGGHVTARTHRKERDPASLTDIKFETELEDHRNEYRGRRNNEKVCADAGVRIKIVGCYNYRAKSVQYEPQYPLLEMDIEGGQGDKAVPTTSDLEDDGRSVLLSMELFWVWTGKGQPTSIFGKEVGPGGISEAEKVWNVLSALGNIALASSFATVIYDIMVRTHKAKYTKKTQTIHSFKFGYICVHCLGHIKVISTIMQTDNVIRVVTMTILLMLCGDLGEAAFGDNTQKNILISFGFYQPFWLVVLGNVFIIIYMVGAYQVRQNFLCLTP